MSDSSPFTKLQLEALPDELLLEVFQYVDAINLFSFKGLNRRIDHIIEDVKLNIFVECQEEDGFDYLSSFAPTQIIRLDIRGYWPSLNFNTITELRSLTLDCNYLSKEQLNQVAQIHLTSLERLSMANIVHHLPEFLLCTIFNVEHFPLLKKCQLKLRSVYDLNHKNVTSSPNNVLRSLTIDHCHWSEFGSLLYQLPNLRRLETSFEYSTSSILNSVPPHFSMRHLRITLDGSLYNLEQLLKSTPNITRLRIRANLGGNDVVDHFEKMAKYLSARVPHLQHFDCEVYCVSYGNHELECIIRQIHPLFTRVGCLLGRGRNKCYATDIKIYPINNEYEESSPRSSRNSFYTDHDDYYDEYEGDYNDNEYEAWERNEYGNGPNMYWDAESDDWCELP